MTRSRFIRNLGIGAATTAAVFAGRGKKGRGPSLDVMAKTLYSKINGQRMYGYVRELADPSYMGRLTGEDGFYEAAEWIAKKFQSWGLQPAGDNGSYYQEFPFPSAHLTAPASFTMKNPQTSEVIEPNIGTDYVVPYYCADISLTDVEVVLVPGNEYGYTGDYEYLNVPGKYGGVELSELAQYPVELKLVF